MSLDSTQVKKMLEENRIVKLDPNRSGGSQKDIIISLLENRALTPQELASEMNIAPNRAYTILRRLEKRGFLVALSKGGREIFYMAKKAL